MILKCIFLVLLNFTHYVYYTKIDYADRFEEFEKGTKNASSFHIFEFRAKSSGTHYSFSLPRPLPPPKLVVDLEVVCKNC